MGTSLFRFLSDFLDIFINFWFSPVCPVCQKWLPTRMLCAPCNPVVPINGNLCDRCGLQIEEKRFLCGACDDIKEYPLNKIRSSLWLTEEAKLIIHLVKFQNRFEWLKVFEDQLKTLPFPYVLGEPVTCVPVPIHTKKFLKRGFNQSEIISDWIAKRFSLSSSFGLEKIRDTSPQSLLDKSQRKTNLISSFKWNPNFKIPEKIILIDDIFTTGETLKSCAQVLKDQGAREVCAWTLFRSKPLQEISLKGF